MRIGKRKLIGAGIVVATMGIAVVIAVLGDLRLLVLYAIAIQLAGFGALAYVSVRTHRAVDRRLARFEKDAISLISHGLENPSFLQSLRSTALPQEHMEQILRTIEAGNARLEAGQDQLAEKVTDVLGERSVDR